MSFDRPPKITTDDHSETPTFKKLTAVFSSLVTKEQIEEKNQAKLAAALKKIEERFAENERYEIAFTSDLDKEIKLKQKLYLQMDDGGERISYNYLDPNMLSPTLISGSIEKKDLPEHFNNLREAFKTADESIEHLLTSATKKAVFDYIENKEETMPSHDEALAIQKKAANNYIALLSTKAESLVDDFIKSGVTSVSEEGKEKLLISCTGVIFLPEEIEAKLPESVRESVAYKTVCRNIAEIEKNWLGAGVTEVTCTISQASSGEIHIAIQDNGCGFPAKFLSDEDGRRFDTFRDTLNALAAPYGACFMKEEPRDDQLNAGKVYVYMDGEQPKYKVKSIVQTKDLKSGELISKELINAYAYPKGSDEDQLSPSDLLLLRHLFGKAPSAGKFFYPDSTSLKEEEKALVAKILSIPSSNGHAPVPAKVHKLKSDKDATKDHGGAGRGMAGYSSELEKGGGRLEISNISNPLGQQVGSLMVFSSPPAKTLNLTQTLSNDGQESYGLPPGLNIASPTASPMSSQSRPSASPQNYSPSPGGSFLSTNNTTAQIMAGLKEPSKPAIQGSSLRIKIGAKESYDGDDHDDESYDGDNHDLDSPSSKPSTPTP